MALMFPVDVVDQNMMKDVDGNPMWDEKYMKATT